MRRKLVVANWKMHGNLVQNEQLLSGIRERLAPLSHVDVAICVPFPYLFQAKTLLEGSNVCWGAQNIAKWQVGAYTGEVSAAMLQDFGAKYVIVGHSERSSAFCESDANIAAKYALAREFGITPILCIGETLQERQAGVMEYAIANQLDAILSVDSGRLLENAVVAYEPVWAIGTGLAATPEQAQAAHGFVRERIRALNPVAAETVRIVYGGSVKPSNAAQLFAMPDIDGGLIGRCSLDVADFEKICIAAS